MISWLPSLLLESGLALSDANLVTSMFLFAGTLGAIGMAWLADRLTHKVRLLSGVLAAAVCTVLLAMHIPVQQIFFFCAIPAVIAGLLIIQVRSPATDAPKSPLHGDILKVPANH